MRSRQIAERLGVEEAHMLEFQKFNEIWDKKMTDYENYAENMVLSLRHSPPQAYTHSSNTGQINGRKACKRSTGLSKKTVGKRDQTEIFT